MGARPRRTEPRPVRRPPPGGTGETRAADYVPVILPPGAEVPTWALGFLVGHPDLVEHRTADGTVVARRLESPRTGLAGQLRADPAVREYLASEADRIAQRATGQPGSGQPVIRSAATRRARAAAWTYSPRDAGWVDIVLDLPDAAWSRCWDRTQRLFAAVAEDGLAPWLLLGVAGQFVAGVGLLDAGWPLAAGPWLAAAVLVAFGVGRARLLRRRAADAAELAATGAEWAMVADLTVGVAARYPDGFTFRDTEVVAFTPVCVCPSCDTLALHWFAVAEVVPEHTAEELPGPVVWRDCAGIGCGFVWAQLR